MTTSGDAVRWLPGLLVLVIVTATLVVFARHLFPVPDGDAVAYLPPMVAWAREEGLVNRAWDKAVAFDPAHEGRFVYHGFLYVMLAGSLAPSGDYRGVVAVLALVTALTLAASFVLLMCTSRLGPTVGQDPALVLVPLALLGLSSSFVGLLYRPETLATAILVVAATLFATLPLRWHPVVAAVALGLLAATYPVGAVLAAGLFAVYTCARLRPLAALGALGLAAGGSMLVFAAAFALVYPFPFRDFLAGVANHAAVAIVPGGSTATQWQYWVVSARNAMYGPLYVAAVLGGLAIAWRDRHVLAWPGGTALAIVATLGLVYYFALRVPTRNYTILIFAPFVYAGLFYAHRRAAAGVASATVRRALTFGVTLLTLATTVGFLRTVCVFPSFLRDARSYADARASLAALRRTTGGTVAVTSGLFALTEDYRNLRVFKGDPPPEAAVAVVQQANTGRKTPPELAGFTLVEDGYSGATPRLFALRIANTPSGYDYAVYRRRTDQDPDLRR